jgi:hypothetical protein
MKWKMLLTRSPLTMGLLVGLLISLPTSRSDALESAARPEESLNGIMQIDGSVVNYVFPDHITASAPFTICFHTTVNSPDLEYMDRLDVNLPDDWTVNSVELEPKASTCPGGTEAGWEAGNVVYWQTDQEIPTGCGPWDNGEYDFCANVTAPSCNSGPWYLPWSIIGDYFGDGPHSTNGSLNPISCEQAPALYLSPNTYFLVGCHTLTHTLTFNLDNQTGQDDTFDIYYDVPGGRAVISGPDGVYLGDGVDQDLSVDLAADPCLPAGTPISATIQAAGGGMLAGTFIWMTTTRGEACPVCYDTCLPLVIKGD